MHLRRESSLAPTHPLRFEKGKNNLEFKVKALDATPPIDYYS
jgi:hypothetical protein